MHSSLRSTQLLMWSSPILLVVLVFTLTSSTTLPTSTKVSTIPTSSITTTSVTKPLVTTTTAGHHHRGELPLNTAPKSTPTTFPAKTVFVPIVPTSSNVTSSTAKSAEPVPSAIVPVGVIAGELTAALDVVEVPLSGPGAWRLTTSGSTRQMLTCAGQTIPLTTQVVVGVNQSCQLNITATAAGTSIAWQLTQFQ